MGLLLEQNYVDLAWEDRDDRTPLSWAMEQGPRAVVKLLPEKGISMD